MSHSLPRQFYTSETLYKMDIEHYWNHSWIWVGHVNQIPKIGDFFLFDYGYESVIVTRDKNKNVNALLNVCRHRGSRVCLEKSGNTRVFACPIMHGLMNLMEISVLRVKWETALIKLNIH